MIGVVFHGEVISMPVRVWPEDNIMIVLLFPGEVIPMINCHGMA